MRNRLHKILPWTALLGALIVIGVLAFSGGQRRQMLIDNGETTRVVNIGLDQIENTKFSSAEDEMLMKAVKGLRESPYVATAWLFNAQGKLLYSSGSTAFQEDVQNRAPLDFKRILTSIPEDTLNGDQSMLLSAASAIQSEGEHNDIYLHQVRAVRNTDGDLVAVVGVAYDISASLGTPDAGWIASMLLGLLGFLVYWLSLPVWTWLDASRNGEPVWIWSVFVLFGNFVALIAYLLVKSAPRRPVIGN